jgi:hypothetical protein
MRVVRCPRCRAKVDWETGKYRPFCSERCRMIDLGAWLDESYVIPGPNADESASDDGRDDES